MSERQSTESWRVLPYGAEPADMQLAAGDALLSDLAAGETRPALRWYRMSRPALIMGSGQKLHEFDLDACRRAGVTLHRRASGGTAVLVEPDQIMHDLALPAGHRLHRQDVTESYRWLGEVWVAALESLGLTAHLIPVAEARADTQALDALTRRACYGGRSPYEVLAMGRKVVGLAQVRRRQGVLLQASVYVRWQPRRLVELFAMPEAERAALEARLQARVAGLADVLPVLGTVPDLLPVLREALEGALRERQGVALEPATWSAAALAARDERAARYAALSLDPGEH
jgi:lipoate-protein ligase A